MSTSYLALLLAFVLGVFPTAYPLPQGPGHEDDGSRVVVGADRLLTEFSHLVDGRRVALVSNHSGRLSDGTHLADALHEYDGTTLVALFGMNFNIRTNDYSLPRETEATVDEPTGVPKYSLYGGVHKPAPAMLEGVDVIVFDIQEVGVRFYEHINILGFVMEAAAENNIDVVVLDRPNPLTGLHMDGFVTDDSSRFGFGAYGPVPVVHGMTMGELALLYNGEGMLRNGVKADLHVVEMEGWTRSMWYDETGLDWSKPSPNLPTLNSVLAYAGTCLFEGLNLSEGRGTEKPFEYIGATWLDNHEATRILNNLGLEGVTFEPITFQPERQPFHGSDPFLAGENVRGIYVDITNRDSFMPYRAGVAMVWAVHTLHADSIKWNEPVLQRLTATPRLVNMIRGGSHPEEIYAAWENEVAAFREISREYWLYE